MTDGRAVNMIGERWYTKVFADSRSEATDIGAATDGRGEVGDGEAIAWRAAFFEDIPIGPDVCPSEVITQCFAEVGYWWDAINFCECVFYYFGTHFGFDFS